MDILGLFIERKEKPVVKKDVEKQVAPAYVPTYSPSSVIQEYTEHFSVLLREENEKNFPGNDFFEFVLVKNGLGSLPEEQRYQIAFQSLSAAGLTKERLITTAQKYISIIESEVSGFNSSYDHAYAETVTKMKEEIRIKSERITALSKEINEMTLAVTQLSNQSMENEHKLSEKRSGFVMAGNNKKAELEGELNKINNYIN